MSRPSACNGNLASARLPAPPSQGKTAQNQQGQGSGLGDAGLAEISLPNLVVREGHSAVAVEVALCPGGPSAEAGFKRLVIGEADCAVPVGVSGAT